MRTTATLLFAAIAAAVSTAQQIPEGLAAAVQPLPTTTSCALVLPQGLVTFDGHDLVLAPPAQPPQVLLHLPAFVFASFAIDAGGGRVLFAENSTNNVWLVPLLGPAPTAPLATLTGPYDAAMMNASRALVSAKLGGFPAPDNTLVVLDLTNGTTQTLAQLPGASGPVAIDGAGDVYYATASNSFPAPPASVDVLRLRANVVAQALAASSVLGLANAETVCTGLDAAADLAFDDDGDLLFVDWWNARIGQIDDAAGASAAPGANVVDYALASTGAVTLQFVPGPGSGVFEPFQPPRGTLHVFESDFFSSAAVRAVRAAPAVLTASASSPIPSGPVALTVAGGPALGIGVLAFATGTAPGTATLLVPGFEQPLAWSSALLAPPVTILLSFDGAGAASFAFANPGFATPLAATAQVLFVSATNVLGASNPLPLAFGQ